MLRDKFEKDGGSVDLQDIPLLIDEYQQALAEKDRQYQQLMAQAVEFSSLVCECWESNQNMVTLQEYHDAKAFLKEHP